MYQFPITIDKTKVGGTLADFVFLFSELTATIPAGFWAHAAGNDIRFFDTNGVTELDREIVLFDSVNSKVQIWIRIPSIGTTVNKIIYCRYGGGTLANNLLWPDSVAVYHAENAITVSDSSPNDEQGNAIGTVSAVAGKTGKGFSFGGPGSPGYVSIPYLSGDVDKFNITGDYTISMLVKPNPIGTTAYSLIVKRSGAAGDSATPFILLLDNRSSSMDLLWIIGGGSGHEFDFVSAGFFTESTWVLLHCVISGTDTKVYQNGMIFNAGVFPYTRQSNGTVSVELGRYNSAGSEFWLDGMLDEVRVFSTAKSAEMILTEANSMMNPATFAACGNETPYPPPNASGFLPFFLNQGGRP